MEIAALRLHSESMNKQDVIIIGGSLIGLTQALALAAHEFLQHQVNANAWFSLMGVAQSRFPPGLLLLRIA